MTINDESSAHIEALKVPAHAVAGFGELLSLELEALDLPDGTAELIEGLATACSEFIGQLDRIEQLLVTSNSDLSTSRPAAAAPMPAGRRRVLIVDDSPANQLLTTAQFERFDVETESVSSGEAALEILETQRFSLILMDWHMPGLDGLQTTAKIREQEKATGAQPHKIVALTARAMVGDKERCLAAGMDDFLAKPVSLQDLRQVLDAHTQPGISAVPDVSSASTLEPATPENFDPPADLVIDAIDAIDHSIYEALIADIGSPDIVRTLAVTFRTELVQRLDDFTQARLDGDTETMRRSVHTIKGTSALFGATALGECAAELEQRSQQGPVPDALVARLHQLATATDQTLESLIAGGGSAKVPIVNTVADRAA